MTLTGKIYDIDLTQGGIEALEFTEAMAREYLGGFGFAVATLYREVPAGTDPLGPENLLVIGP
ncbi:MAG: aldehyde ferredoxin oxidoreductase N-terminal domain-containing protein, partial [Desulfobacterales bacterium]